jgi:cobalt/nickel transport system ATP-binding protein
LSGDVLLSGDAVSYRYLGRYPALEAVSLTVREGQSLALLGANGSGKSTLLKVLAGLVFCQSGTLSAFGEPVTEDCLADHAANARFRSRVGLVFQNPAAQLFSATVEEDLRFGCRQLGLDAAETDRRIGEAADMLEIRELLGRSPAHLSVGQQKRAAIGSVLVMSPQVLLFDEPTAALDPRTAAWLTDLLRTLREAGRTLVIATHDLRLAGAVSEQCLVLGEDHRVAATAPADDVLTDQPLLGAANLIAPGAVTPRVVPGPSGHPEPAPGISHRSHRSPNRDPRATGMPSEERDDERRAGR